VHCWSHSPQSPSGSTEWSGDSKGGSVDNGTEGSETSSSNSSSTSAAVINFDARCKTPPVVLIHDPFSDASVVCQIGEALQLAPGVTG